jgi:hypothetical protein
MMIVGCFLDHQVKNLERTVRVPQRVSVVIRNGLVRLPIRTYAVWIFAL